MMTQINTSTEAAIDRKLGLDRYEGDEKIYKNVLENFMQNNKNTLKDLNNAVNANDIKLAYCIAHSLRGAAGTIGATRLADAAFSVENSLSPANAEPDSTRGEVFEKQIALLESEHINVFTELKLLVKEKKEPAHDSRAMDREKTLGLIDKLTPLLESGDANSLEYLDEINERFQSAAEGFKLFTSQMERYDFEQALETMNSIRQFMAP